MGDQQLSSCGWGCSRGCLHEALPQQASKPPRNATSTAASNTDCDPALDPSPKLSSAALQPCGSEFQPMLAMPQVDICKDCKKPITDMHYTCLRCSNGSTGWYLCRACFARRQTRYVKVHHHDLTSMDAHGSDTTSGMPQLTSTRQHTPESTTWDCQPTAIPRAQQDTEQAQNSRSANRVLSDHNTGWNNEHTTAASTKLSNGSSDVSSTLQPTCTNCNYIISGVHHHCGKCGDLCGNCAKSRMDYRGSIHRHAMEMRIFLNGKVLACRCKGWGGESDLCKDLKNCTSLVDVHKADQPATSFGWDHTRMNSDVAPPFRNGPPGGWGVEFRSDFDWNTSSAAGGQGTPGFADHRDRPGSRSKGKAPVRGRANEGQWSIKDGNGGWSPGRGSCSGPTVEVSNDRGSWSVPQITPDPKMNLFPMGSSRQGRSSSAAESTYPSWARPEHDFGPVNTHYRRAEFWDACVADERANSSRLGPRSPLAEEPWTSQVLAGTRTSHTRVEVSQLEQRIDEQEARLKALLGKHHDTSVHRSKVHPTATANNDMKGGFAASNMLDEIKFLRRCLKSSQISQEDRYKALGIISMLQGDDTKSQRSDTLNGESSGGSLSPSIMLGVPGSPPAVASKGW